VQQAREKAREGRSYCHKHSIWKFTGDGLVYCLCLASSIVFSLKQLVEQLQDDSDDDFDDNIMSANDGDQQFRLIFYRL